MKLGRIHIEDPRDANFPMALRLAAVPLKVPKSRSWRGQALRVDQGNIGACVGYAGSNWEGHLPIATKITNQTGLDLYHACKAIDGMPNEEGSNDRFLAKVLVAQGRIERYLWAQNIDDLRTWVLTTGPVLVGTEWANDMFDPDSKHVLHPTGAVAGGHEWLVKGYQSGKYRMRNSWGASWGDNGEAWISEADLASLVFARNGDALGAVEKTP